MSRLPVGQTEPTNPSPLGVLDKSAKQPVSVCSPFGRMDHPLLAKPIPQN